MSIKLNENGMERKFQFSEHIWISILVLSFLYLLLNILSVIITLILTPKEQEMSPITFAIVLLAINLPFLFIFVPRYLQLPNGKKYLPEYLKDIRLKSSQPIVHILAIGITCYIIYMSSQLLGSLVYGHYSFDLNLIFPPNSWGIIQNIPYVIFEEVIFRGIILTLLLKKFSEKLSILISAVIFGSYHILGLISIGITYENLIWTSGMVVWAFFIGLFYGYTFVKTKSLLPGIMVHYLSNTLINLWVVFPGAAVGLHVLYAIIFDEGILPTALAIIWVRFYVDHWLPVYESS